MLFMVVFIGCLLAVFSLALCVPYFLARNSRYREGIRTWIVVFYFEVFILVFIPKVNIPTLGVYNVPGFVYLVGFVTRLQEIVEESLHAHRSDFLLLVLIPLVPAVIIQKVDFSKWDDRPPTG